MSIVEVAVALSDEKPSVISICMDLMTHEEEIDPQSMRFGVFMWMDEFEIYGERIWRLYDLCQKSLLLFMATIRAVQLGIISRSALDGAINGEGQLDLPEILEQVRDRLNQFGRN